MRAISRALCLGLALLVAGCQGSATYFEAVPQQRVWIPTVPGREVLLGNVALQAHAGDSVRLLSALANGLPSGVTVVVYALPLYKSQGGVGAQDTRDMGRGRDFDDFARPLAGFEFVESDGPIELVFGLTINQPGLMQYSSSTVQFTVNGGPTLHQDFTMGGFSCVDDPRPTSCAPLN